MDPSRYPDGFRDLVGACLADNHSLLLTIGGDAVSVALAQPRDDVMLAGTPRICDALPSAPPEFPGTIVLPLALRLAQLHLPRQAMLTAGRAGSSASNFFTRNLFFAASSLKPITVAPMELPDVGHNLSNALRLEYWFLLKTTCPDRFLEAMTTQDALAHVLISAVTPLDRIENAVLRNGVAALRRHQDPSARARAALAARLSETRQRVLTASGA